MNNCPVEGCKKKVPSHRLMCPGHWRMVPANLAKMVWHYWQRGPSDKYLKVRQDAIDAVNRAETEADRLKGETPL